MSTQQLKRFNSMERRPRMLKDFLSENLNSCSSSGFESLPRKPTNNNNSMHSLIEMELKSSSSSSSSPFQTLINTIRSISLFTPKSPSVLSLPRSLSRKLSSSRRRTRRRRSRVCSDVNITTAVKIKDIIRWKSFRDIVVESSPLPPPPPPLDFMVGSTNTTTCSSCSSGSSWIKSDFLTLEEAQNDNVEAAGKRFSFISHLLVGSKNSWAKETLTCQEEQHSPVSVLQVGEDEFSPFDQSLANIQRRKQKFIQTVQKLESLAKFDLANLDQCLSLDDNSGYDEEYEEDDADNEVDIEEQDWIEEKAKQLLNCVKARGSADGCRDYLDTLLLDFFREELSGGRNQYKNEEEFELETLRITEDWINGSFAFDAGHVDKHAYIKDMERRDQWSRFEEEQEELAFEIETAILHSLVADLLDMDG
ncbi:hypothetical protein AAZX31_03G016400 [Glycine max]|nr:hypothetical protein JHK86_006078 [Glycine max]KAH1256183.1 hypothetical protein GmHk_03G006390 [Glycine max]